MKVVRTLLVLLSFLVGCNSVVTAATPMQQAREVVVMLGSTNPMVSGSCSAVVLEPGLAITAAHCTGMPDLVLKMHDGMQLSVSNFTVKQGKDVAFLQVPGLQCPCAVQTETPAQVDELAYAVGYPFAIGSVLTVGYIQGRVTNPDDGVEYLLSTTSAAPGNSGGGLFVVRDGKAYLVGITVAMAGAGVPIISVELLSL